MAGRKGLIWETAAQPTRMEVGPAHLVVIRHPDLTALPSSQTADKQEGRDKDNQQDGQGQAEEARDLSLEPSVAVPMTGAGLQHWGL